MSLNKTIDDFEHNNETVEIFGLGYVGFPLLTRLVVGGLNTIGIDINNERIKRLSNADLRDSEIYLKKEFTAAIKNDKIKLKNKSQANENSRVGIICVPTPVSDEKFDSDHFVLSVVTDFLSNSKKGDVLILESSIGVGTTEKIKKIIESAGYIVGKDFGLAYCPERIDPMNKKWNLENIPRVVFASDNITFEIIQKIYLHVNNKNLLRVKSAEIAEVVKSYENTFRLVNISLVNELAMFCEKIKIKVNDVIDAAASKPFGFMPFYPGAGAGGHCIPKDPIFLLKSAKKIGSNFSTIEKAIEINEFIPKHIAESISTITKDLNTESSVIIVGLTYKADVEDFRDSPGFKIVKELQKNKFKIGIFDPYFNFDSIEKYYKENNIESKNFEIITSLEEENIIKFAGICVVQHHTKLKFKITEIYKNSKVKFLYDCQGKITKIPESKTSLESFGN